MSNLKITDSHTLGNLDSGKLNLDDYLNAIFKNDMRLFDAYQLEEVLAYIDHNSPSMRGFLEVLINSSLWQGWQIESNPYLSMILQIGSKIDHLASLKAEPAYHSKFHMMDVCLIVTCLLACETSLQPEDRNHHLWQTSHREKWLLLLSAAAHDLGHPGRMNSYPYEIEKDSLHLLQVLLEKEGYNTLQIEDVMNSLSPWILATDHSQYIPLVNRLEGTTPSHTDCMAMLLVEADVTSSVLPNRGRVLTKRLSEEWENLYAQQSAALLNLLGYLKFLENLKFISPHAAVFQLPIVLKKTIAKVQSELV